MFTGVWFVSFCTHVRCGKAKTDTSDPRHFGTSMVGPNCPNRSVLAPKCPKDSSDLSAKLSCPKCRTVPSQVLKCLGPFLTTTVCSRHHPYHNRFTAFFRDHPGEPAPEENFWTLWFKRRLTEADTPTIQLGATHPD